MAAEREHFNPEPREMHPAGGESTGEVGRIDLPLTGATPDVHGRDGKIIYHSNLFDQSKIEKEEDRQKLRDNFKRQFNEHAPILDHLVEQVTNHKTLVMFTVGAGSVSLLVYKNREKIGKVLGRGFHELQEFLPHHDQEPPTSSGNS